MKSRSAALIASLVAVASLGSVGAYTLYERRAEAGALAAVRDEARLRGASAAIKDIRAGHVVLHRVCNSPAAVEWWRREHGVECTLNIFQSCGYGDPIYSESQRLWLAAYDEVMVRHVRARFGTRVFQVAREQVHAVSEPPILAPY